MQVNSSTAYTPQSSPSLSVDTQLRTNQQGEQLIVRERSEAREQQNAQTQNSEQQRQERFDINEQAIAEFERQSQEQQQTQQNDPQQNGLQAQPENNSQSSSQQSAEYDQPNARNQTAISAYQNVDYIPQREAIKQSFGVDLYA